MSNKWVKTILALIAAGITLGGILCLLKKPGCCCSGCKEEEEEEDEDYDLDALSSREYVSLTPKQPVQED